MRPIRLNEVEPPAPIQGVEETTHRKHTRWVIIIVSVWALWSLFHFGMEHNPSILNSPLLWLDALFYYPFIVPGFILGALLNGLLGLGEGPGPLIIGFGLSWTIYVALGIMIISKVSTRRAMASKRDVDERDSR